MNKLFKNKVNVVLYITAVSWAILRAVGFYSTGNELPILCRFFPDCGYLHYQFISFLDLEMPFIILGIAFILQIINKRKDKI